MADINNLSQPSLIALALSIIILIIGLSRFFKGNQHTTNKVVKWVLLIIFIGSVSVTVHFIKHDSNIETAQIAKTRQQNVKTLASQQKQLTKLKELAAFWGIKANQATSDKAIKQALSNQNNVQTQITQLQSKIASKTKAIKAVNPDGSIAQSSSSSN